MAIISNCTASIIKDAALALKEGHLVAFPTETVYGLGADATNEKAVARIYEVKGRPKDHPLIVHISSAEMLDKWASEIPEYAIKLAREFWPGPMSLILPRTSIAKDFITGGQDTVAVRVPAHPIGLELIKQFENIGGQGIAAPSANRFGKVSPTNANAVQIELGNYLSQKDEILDGGFSTVGIESTIIDCSSSSPTILRPGGVSAQMVEDLLKIKLTNLHLSNYFKKAPGLLESHYSPNAQIILNGEPMPGDGFIALSEEKTPIGTIRLSAPVDTDQYAQDLYNSFRLGDTLKLSRIIAILPEGSGISVAIRDRLQKAAGSKA